MSNYELTFEELREIAQIYGGEISIVINGEYYRLIKGTEE